MKKKLKFYIGWQKYAAWRLLNIDILNTDDDFFSKTILKLQIFRFIIDIYIEEVENEKKTIKN